MISNSWNKTEGESISQKVMGKVKPDEPLIWKFGTVIFLISHHPTFNKATHNVGSGGSFCQCLRKACKEVNQCILLDGPKVESTFFYFGEALGVLSFHGVVAWIHISNCCNSLLSMLGYQDFAQVSLLLSSRSGSIVLVCTNVLVLEFLKSAT